MVVCRTGYVVPFDGTLKSTRSAAWLSMLVRSVEPKAHRYGLLPGRTCPFIPLFTASRNQHHSLMGITSEIQSCSLFWATSAPLPNTIPAFLALCTPLTPAAKRPKLIVQLTAPVEGGRRKAHEYLPTKIGRAAAIRYPLQSHGGTESAQSDSEHFLEVILCDRRDIPGAGTVQSSLELTICTLRSSLNADNIQRNQGLEERGETMRVTHFYYGAWPDFGVPTEPRTILNLARLVDGESMAGNWPASDAPKAGRASVGDGGVSNEAHCIVIFLRQSRSFYSL